eukprot:6275121-Amphidinium_carterae.1
MYWSDDESSDAEPVVPSRQKAPSAKRVSFNDKVEIREYFVDNLQEGLTRALSRRQRARASPVDASTSRSFKSEKEAVKRAIRWRASMDSDNDDAAVAAVARRWLIDTGSAYDLTANGVMEASKRATEKVNTLRSTITPLLLDSTPDALSVGRRCMTEGYSFHWESGMDPYFIDKKGRKISMTVDRYIPYLNDTPDIASPVEVHSGHTREPEDDLFLVDNDENEAVNIIPDVQVSEHDYGSIVPEGDIIQCDQAMTGRQRGHLLKEAQSTAHQLTHLPKNPFCHTCARGKATNKRSPHTSGSDLYKQAKRFGDVVTVDNAIAMSPGDYGLNGEMAMIAVLDVCTRWLQCYPVESKESDEICEALRDFCGPNLYIKTMYSDNAPELVRAAQVRSWVHERSVPGISKNNGLVERM